MDTSTKVGNYFSDDVIGISKIFTNNVGVTSTTKYCYISKVNNRLEDLSTIYDYQGGTTHKCKLKIYDNDFGLTSWGGISTCPVL